MTQNIAAVVVTYNRKALLKKCIDHILKQSAGAPDILVIDNASTDGTGGFITEEYKDVSDDIIAYINVHCAKGNPESCADKEDSYNYEY